MKKYIFLLLLAWGTVNPAGAHEPLYGFGPHVLFKNGFAPHLTIKWNQNQFENEYALGYGITRNWTLIGELPWAVKDGKYRLSGAGLKSKYRFWLKAGRGISHQASVIAKLDLPAQGETGSLLSMALTAGQEALHLYWFAGAGYAVLLGADEPAAGSHMIYNFSIGYRPHKVNYYKPDLVFFMESSGKLFAKRKENGQIVESSGGANLGIGPSFFFTYRNLAIRGGVQYGLWNGAFVPQIEKNYKFTFELHI